MSLPGGYSTPVTASVWITFAFAAAKALRTWGLFVAGDMLSVWRVPIPVLAFLLVGFSAIAMFGKCSAGIVGLGAAAARALGAAFARRRGGVDARLHAPTTSAPRSLTFARHPRPRPPP